MNRQFNGLEQPPEIKDYADLDWQIAEGLPEIISDAFGANEHYLREGLHVPVGDRPIRRNWRRG